MTVQSLNIITIGATNDKRGCTLLWENQGNKAKRGLIRMLNASLQLYLISPPVSIYAVGSGGT